MNALSEVIEEVKILRTQVSNGHSAKEVDMALCKIELMLLAFSTNMKSSKAKTKSKLDLPPNLLKMIESAVDENVAKHVDPLKSLLNSLVVERSYTISEVAAIMNKHHVTIREWIKDGKLKATQHGRIWEISQTQLDEFRNKISLHSSYHD